MLTSERATWSVLTGGSDLEGSWHQGCEARPPQSRLVLPSGPHAFPLGPSLPWGCQRSRVQQPSSRLIVPSLGDGCSKNSLGLTVNQDETRVTGCELRPWPGSAVERGALNAHRMPRALVRPLTARAPGSRPRGRGDGAVGILTSRQAEPAAPQGTHGRLGFSPSLTGCVQRAHVMPGVAVRIRPLPPVSRTRSPAPRSGEEVRRAAGEAALGVGGAAGGLTHGSQGVAVGLGRGSCRVTSGVRRLLL